MSVRQPVNLSYQVYRTIPEFFEHRGHQGGADLLTQDVFMTQFTQNGYESIKSTDGEIIVFIIRDGSDYTTSGPQLRKLIGRANAIAGNEVGEIVVVAPEPALQKKNITSAFDSLSEEADKKGKSQYILAVPYSVFAQNIPAHAAVPKHEVASAEDVAEMLGKRFSSTAELPAIYAQDPPVVWAGGRPGDIIRVERLSETTGTTPAFRRVIT